MCMLALVNTTTTTASPQRPHVMGADIESDTIAFAMQPRDPTGFATMTTKGT